MGVILAILVIGIVATMLFLKSPAGRGKIGEFKVNLAAKLSLDPNQYALIPNVILPVDGGTTQIDLLIVSEYGVFVVETKNMNGWIYGAEKDEQWTQVLYRRKCRFQNPIRQNYAHVCAVEQLLKVPRDKIFPIVVFAGDATFKTPVPGNVLRMDEFMHYINGTIRKVLSREEVLNIILRLFDRRLTPGWRTNRRHINNLKRRFGR